MSHAEFRKARRVSDAVVSSYIHDISTRTGAAASAPARRPSGSARPHRRGLLRRSQDLIHARRDHQAV